MSGRGKKMGVIGVLVCAAFLTALAAAPALAKPPGGMPPGQAKKIAGGQQQGPPPWAPAHGQRAKYQYRYYPGSQVYYDLARHLYFWQVGGVWRQAPRLPEALLLITAGAVILDMMTAEPYVHQPEVERWYPATPPNGPR